MERELGDIEAGTIKHCIYQNYLYLSSLVSYDSLSF